MQKYRNHIKGFVRKSGGVLLSLVLAGVLLTLSGITAEHPTPAANTPQLSDWNITDTPDISYTTPAATKIGSFALVQRPAGETLLHDITSRWHSHLQSAFNRDDFTAYLKQSTHDTLTSRHGAALEDWLAPRGEQLAHNLGIGTADFLTDYLLTAAEDRTQRFSFVRNIEWDYTSGLGERKWHSGISALGALREGADDAVVWQMRGYVGEDSSIGSNAGIIYRRAVSGTQSSLDDAMLGINTFLDYEKTDIGDTSEGFWRWSVGGEIRSQLIDIYLNKYLPLTDDQTSGDDIIYSREGVDAELRFNPPGQDKIAAGLTYYNWQGEYGQDDDKGMRYHLHLKNLGRGLFNHLQIEAELDKPQGSSVKFGGRIAYNFTYRIGAPAQSVGSNNDSGSSSDDTFEARDHFYAPARREYNQRISIAEDAANGGIGGGGGGGDVPIGGGGNVNIEATAGTAQVIHINAAVLTTTNLDSAGEAIVTANADNNITVDTGAAGVVRMSSELRSWQATVHADSTIALLAGASTLSISGGSLNLTRPSGGIGYIAVTNLYTVTLVGTQLHIDHAGRGTYDTYLHLTEGTITIEVTNTSNITIQITDAEAQVSLPAATITAGCASAQQLDDAAANTIGISCANHITLSNLPTDNTIEIDTARGEALTLRGNGTRLSVSTYAGVWDNYPFYGRSEVNAGRLIHTGGDVANLSFGGAAIDIGSGSDSDGTTLLFSPSEAASLTIYLLAGKLDNIGGDTLDCSDAASPLGAFEDPITVILACGAGLGGGGGGGGGDVDGIRFQDPDLAPYTRTGINYTISYTAIGANPLLREYDLTRISSGSDILAITATTGNDVDLLISGVEAGTVNYRLEAKAIPALTSYISGDIITLGAYVVDEFGAGEGGDGNGSGNTYTATVIAGQEDIAILTITLIGDLGTISTDVVDSGNNVTASAAYRSDLILSVTSSYSLPSTNTVTLTVTDLGIDGVADSSAALILTAFIAVEPSEFAAVLTNHATVAYIGTELEVTEINTTGGYNINPYVHRVTPTDKFAIATVTIDGNAVAVVSLTSADEEVNTTLVYTVTAEDNLTVQVLITSTLAFRDALGADDVYTDTTNTTLYVIGGGGGLGGEGGSPLTDVWSTEDPIAAWTLRNPTLTAFIGVRTEGIAFDRIMYIIGNSDADKHVVHSNNGLDWTAAASAPPWGDANRAGLNVFNQQIVHIGGRGTSGDLDEVWSSTNGTAWNLLSTLPQATYRMDSVVLNGKLYVLGGVRGTGTESDPLIYNDSYVTENGTDWTALPDAPELASPAGAAFKQRLYMIGSQDDSVARDSVPVWRSRDEGRTWRLATTIAAGSTFGSELIVYGERMYLLGGTEDPSNDVWYTDDEDGEVWTRATDAPWSNRNSFSAIIFGRDATPPAALVP